MFYIFHGEDYYSKKETISALISKLGDASMLELNTTRLNGTGLSLGALQDACNAMPFLAPKRLVIVEEMLQQKFSKSEMDALLAYLVEIPDTTRLIFLESKPLGAKNKVVKLAEEHEKGFVKLFEAPQGGQLERWIVQRAKALGGQMEPRAANLLAINVGNDLGLLDQEIQKLVMYAGLHPEASPIEAADVQLLSPYAAESSIFNLVDALGNRNGQVAAQLLQKKLDEGAEPFFIFSMFVRQFRLLIQVKEQADEGLRPPSIAKKIKIHSFVAGKLFQQSQHFSMAQLEQIYAHLLDIDVGVKTGRTDMVTALNLLVFNLAAA